MQPILNAPLVVRLKGTQKEMGGQYGEILAAQGGYQDLLEFYPHMAENLLVSGLPRRARTKTARFIASQLIQTAARSLSKYRNDEYAARQSALLKAAGITEALAQQQLVMDVFQNSIGVLGRFGILHANERAYLNAIPACTSAVVWDSLSRDGELMHARNFDFPGVGVWDKIPTIVYSTPDKGIPYGYIGARGADVPGITAFNSEGLSVAFHTRFHRDVDFNALGVIDLGHDIVRNARTTAEAIEIITRQRIASTWGILVTSAKEKKAVLIETTGKKCRVTWGQNDAHAQTNHYLHSDLQEGEIATNAGWIPYTTDRLRFIETFFASIRQHGGATLTDMENLLGADYEIDSPNTHRAAGSLVGHVMSVQSVVFKLQSGLISLSVGEAPTGFGPFIHHEVNWSGAAYEQVDLSQVEKTTVTAHYRNGKNYTAYKHFQNAYLKDFEGAPLAEISTELERAYAINPTDVSLAFLTGIYALEKNNLETAAARFNEAIATEASPFRLGQNLLWASRAAAAMGNKNEATALRKKLLDLPHASLGELKAQAQKDAARLFPRRDFSGIVVNMAVLDAA